MKLRTAKSVLLALSSIAAAQAQDAATSPETNWRGFYIGVNAGGAWNHTCDDWTPSNAISNSVIATAFANRNCPNNSTFIGGAQIGYNFQKGPFVWGFGLDYEIWSAKNRYRSFTYNGPVPPPNGTYTFSGKVNPDGFLLLGPRIGYAVDQWLPYFRVGGVFTNGSHNSTTSFTDASGTASFSGGKNFKSSGFGVGAGVEYALADAWSIGAEYTYVRLGKGSNTVTTCTGTPATCAAFSNISLESIHNSLTANIFRMRVNYRFGGRSPAAAPVAAAPLVAVPPPPPPSPPPAPPPPPSPPPLCPGTPPGVAVDQYGCPCDMTQEVHFATDSAVLTDEDKGLLDKMIVTLKRLHFVEGQVGGYTDSTGSAAYNQGLSERRAQAVADYLATQGIASSRITVKGYGATNPVADNSTREGRAHNRRVVLHRTGCAK